MAARGAERFEISQSQLGALKALRGPVLAAPGRLTRLLRPRRPDCLHHQERTTGVPDDWDSFRGHRIQWSIIRF